MGFMGVMRFLVHPPDAVRQLPEISQAFLSGLDGRIFPTRVEVEGNLIQCRRPMSESAKFNVNWPISGIGRPLLNTCSLREREEPYLLAVELARGKLAEIREYSAVWEQAGMAIPDAFRRVQKEAFVLFARAGTTSQGPVEASRLASLAIEAAARAASILVDAYTVQRLANIRRSKHQTPGLLGCVVDSQVLTEAGQQTFHQAFNTVSVPISWKDIEPVEGEYNWEHTDALVRFATEHRHIVRGGPLIKLSPNGLPDWLAPWKNDFLNLPSFICDFIETSVARYLGRIRFWEVSAFGNTGGALDLPEDHCLALTARTLEAAKRTDSDAQFFIRIDRPWGEYQRDGKHRLSPIQFVDALIRSNLGLAGVTLEINCGYGPIGCYARDMLSVSRLIDAWSQLGIQIHVNVASPAAAGPDPLADPQFPLSEGVWRDRWNEETQSEWIESIVPLLMAKPAVTGVFLSQFSDAVGHRFPHAGLFSSDGRLRQMFDPLRRQSHHDLS
jgi:hypothetical protein